MSYVFKILEPPLHTTAEAAIEWFKKHWGISAAVIQVEPQLETEIALRPTFSCKTNDFHTLCIEVADSIYPNYIDAFVLYCRDKGLPIKLFIAVRGANQDTEYSKKLKEAKRAGVGILEINENGGTVIQQPISLSLAGVRAIDVVAFPKKYRQALVAAEQAFRDGTPPKACAMIYDELEAVFRIFADKVESKGWWNNPGWDTGKQAWANLVTHIDSHLNRGGCNCPELTPAFMARIHGVTPFRNDAGHKPGSAHALKKRDQELRTRFEAAVDLFKDFLQATKPLRL